MKFPFRSLLFVPGNNKKFVDNASKTRADVLLLDIEDSVQQKSKKQIARDLIEKSVKNQKLNNKIIFPRVNDRESGELIKDLSQLTIRGIQGFMFPKSLSGDDIYFYDKILETLEYEKNFPIGTFKMIALIETTSALMNLKEICSRSNRLLSIAFGCEDYITDLQGMHDKNYLSIFNARSQIAIAARANNIIPIDTVHIDINNLDDLRKNIYQSKSLGFEGMLALHPKEIDIINEMYKPNRLEYLEAKNIVKIAEKSYREGVGVLLNKGKLIGPPIVKNAENVIKKYDFYKKFS